MRRLRIPQREQNVISMSPQKLGSTLRPRGFCLIESEMAMVIAYAESSPNMQAFLAVTNCYRRIANTVDRSCKGCSTGQSDSGFQSRKTPSLYCSLSLSRAWFCSAGPSAVPEGVLTRGITPTTCRTPVGPEVGVLPWVPPCRGPGSDLREEGGKRGEPAKPSGLCRRFREYRRRRPVQAFSAHTGPRRPATPCIL